MKNELLVLGIIEDNGCLGFIYYHISKNRLSSGPGKP